MREMKNETRKAENKTRIRDCLKKRAFWKGSYTVEAALVFPIILFVLAALLILAFYVHDCGILQGLACETAVAGSNYITENERKAGTESGGAGTAHGEQKQSGACGVWKFRGLCAIYGSLSGSGNGDALFVRKSAEDLKKLAGPYAESI